MSIAGTISSLASSALSQAGQAFGQTSANQASNGFPDPASLNTSSPAPGVQSGSGHHHHHQPDATDGQAGGSQQVAGTNPTGTSSTGTTATSTTSALTAASAQATPSTAGNLLSADLDRALQSYASINNMA